MAEPRTFKLTIAYDGTGLVGWQRQAEGTSVQGLLEDALTRLTATAGVTVTGAGRTDAGVHARGQVASTTLATQSGAGRPAARRQRAAAARCPRARRRNDGRHLPRPLRRQGEALRLPRNPRPVDFAVRRALRLAHPVSAGRRGHAGGAAAAARPPRFRRISVNRVRYTGHRADTERRAARRGPGGGWRHPAGPDPGRRRLSPAHGAGHCRQPGRSRPRTLASRPDRGDSRLRRPRPGGADGAPARPVPGVGSILRKIPIPHESPRRHRPPAARFPRGPARAADRRRRGCRATSRSSWTATAAGPRSATCRGSRGTAPGIASVRDVGRDVGPARPPGAHALRLLGRELEAAAHRGQPR